MWSSVVTDLSGTQLGEVVDAHAREVYIGINRTPTMKLACNVDSAFGPQFRDQDVRLKVYDSAKVLRFHGPVVNVEDAWDESSSRLSLNVLAAGPSWYLPHRLAGKSATGTIFTATDKAQVAKSLIDTTNTENETGISTSGSIASGSTVSSYTAGPYKPVSECIKDLSNSLDGFDWIVDPIEPSGGKIGSYRAAAVIGSTQSEAIFEFGTGRANIRSYNRQKDWSTVANQAYHIADDGAASTAHPPVSALDAASIAARGLFEDIATASGLTDTTLRTALCQEHVSVRKQPRLVYTFNPDFPDGSSRIPSFGTDYNVGDLVMARGRYSGQQLFAGYMRVYAVTITIDDNGQASVVPTLIDDDPAS